MAICSDFLKMREKIMEKCPCGTGIDYKECCALYIEGGLKPPSAETLMRARYSAYVQKEIDFVMETHDPKTRKEASRESSTEWANNAKWFGLKILKTGGGGEADKTGTVLFIAEYKLKGKKYRHHEEGEFVKKWGTWYFSNSRMINDPIVNEAKIGRNEPCPCGSGKKYKKCCG